MQVSGCPRRAGPRERCPAISSEDKLRLACVNREASGAWPAHSTHTCQITGCKITSELDLKRYKCDDSNRASVLASPLINYITWGLETNTTWVGQPTAASTKLDSQRLELSLNKRPPCLLTPHLSTSAPPRSHHFVPSLPQANTSSPSVISLLHVWHLNHLLNSISWISPTQGLEY